MIALTYEDALRNVSGQMDLAQHSSTQFFDAFEASYALAVVFNIPKEKAIEDLIAYRGRANG